MPSRDSNKNKANMSSPKMSSTDAIQMLKEDHRKVEKLFEQFQQADGGDKQQIAQQIFHELEVHSTLEEELFYPALENQGDSKETTSREQDKELDGEAIMHITESEEASESYVELDEESEIQGRRRGRFSCQRI